MEGDGGDNERGEKEEVPRLKGKEFRFFPFLHRGGRGVSSPYGWGQGAGFVPYPEGLVRPGKRENRVQRGGIFMGGRKEKVNKE